MTLILQVVSLYSAVGMIDIWSVNSSELQGLSSMTLNMNAKHGFLIIANLNVETHSKSNMVEKPECIFFLHDSTCVRLAVKKICFAVNLGSSSKCLVRFPIK